MCFLMPLGYEFLRLSSCWMVLRVWRALLRYCVECPSILVGLKFFLWFTRDMCLGTENHRHEVVFHSHDIDDHTASTCFYYWYEPTSSSCGSTWYISPLRVTLPPTPFPILHAVLFGSKILHAIHTKEWEVIS